MHSQPLSQLAVWEGRGLEGGGAAAGPPGRRPQSAVSSGVSARRGLSLGGRRGPRRRGRVPGRVSLRRAALLRPVLAGSWVRVQAPCSSWPRLWPPSWASLAPQPRVSSEAVPPVPSPLGFWTLVLETSGPLRSSSVIGLRFSLAQKRLRLLRTPLFPPRGCHSVPAPGVSSRQHSCATVPRGRGNRRGFRWPHGRKLLWTFGGQGWGTESLAWMGQTCTEKLGAEEGGRRQPPACAPV